MSDLDAMRRRFYETLPHSVADALAPYEAEIDAYRRAKQENDERFMIERDEARAEVERLRTDFAKHLREQLLAQREISDLLAERVKVLEAAVQAVRDLHCDAGNGTCIHCCDANGTPMSHPCPTTHALDAALGGEQDE